eukprot:gene8420-12021_t
MAKSASYAKLLKATKAKARAKVAASKKKAATKTRFVE